MSIVLAATAAALFGVGTYLVLQRKLSRVIIGLGLLTHGANVLMITAGRRGDAPLIDPDDPRSASQFADPLPQALALTAIVISFGVTALLLALAYRSWVLTEDDEVADDVEDRSVARHGFADSELTDEEALTSELESSVTEEPGDPWDDEVPAADDEPGPNREDHTGGMP